MYVLYHLLAFVAAEMIKIIPVCDAECQKNMLLAKYYPAPNTLSDSSYCVRGVDVRNNKKCVVGVRGVVAQPGNVKPSEVPVNPPPGDVIVSTYYKTVTVNPSIATPAVAVSASVKPSQVVYHSKNVTSSVPAANILPEKAPPAVRNATVPAVAPSVPAPTPIPVAKRPTSPTIPPKAVIVRPTMTITQPPLLIDRPVVRTVTVSQPPIVINRPVVQTVTVAQPPATVSSVQTVTVAQPPAIVSSVHTVTVTVVAPPPPTQTVTKEIRVESKPGTTAITVKQPESKRPTVEISTPISSTVNIKKPDAKSTPKQEPIPVYSTYPPDYSNYYAYYGYRDPRAYYPYDNRYGYYGNYYPPVYSPPGSQVKVSKETERVNDKEEISKYKIVKSVDPAQAKSIIKAQNEKNRGSGTNKENGTDRPNNSKKKAAMDENHDLYDTREPSPDVDVADNSLLEPSYAPKMYPKNWDSNDEANDAAHTNKAKRKKHRKSKHHKNGHNHGKKNSHSSDGDPHRRDRSTEPSNITENPFDKDDSKYVADFGDEYNDNLPKEIHERQPHVNEPQNINRYLYDRIYKKLRNKNILERMNLDNEKNKEKKLKSKYNSIIYIDEQDKMLRNRLFNEFMGERSLDHEAPVRRNGDEIELSDSFSAVLPSKKSKTGEDNNSSSSDEIMFLSDLLK